MVTTKEKIKKERRVMEVDRRIMVTNGW